MKKPIIYFSLVEWDFLWSRPQQLLSRISCNRKVLYVEVHGVRNLASDFHFPEDLFRIFNKLFSWGKALFVGPRKISDNLWVVNPIMLPSSSSLFINKINRKILQFFLKKWSRDFTLNKPILLYTIPRPELLSMIGTLDEILVAYDCMDDYADFPSSHSKLSSWEKELLLKADVVTVSSLSLLESKKQIHSKVILIPNGVEFEHFNTAVNGNLSEPNEIIKLAHPRIIYIGVINEWFDTKLILEVASTHRKWSFILVGIDVIDFEHTSNYDNIIFTGRKEYKDLPNFLAFCDICIIPFKLTPLTIATNPIKLFEYLAAGKPVISTPLPEVKQYNDIVKIVKTSNDFSKAVEISLTEKSSKYIRKRTDFANKHSWDERSRLMEQTLEDALNE